VAGDIYLGTKSCLDQHCRGATVPNPCTGLAKNRPLSQATQASDCGNRYDPSQITDVPDRGAIAVVIRKQVCCVRHRRIRVVKDPYSGLQGLKAIVRAVVTAN
jgi:hypothetical protein